MKKSLLTLSTIITLALTASAQEKKGPTDRTADRITHLGKTLELRNDQFPAVESIVLSTAQRLEANNDRSEMIVREIAQALQEEEGQMRSVLSPDQMKVYMDEQNQKMDLLKELFGVVHVEKSDNKQRMQSTIKR